MASEWLQAHWVNKWRLSRDNPFVFTVVAQCSQLSDLLGIQELALKFCHRLTVLDQLTLD